MCRARWLVLALATLSSFAQGLRLPVLFSSDSGVTERIPAALRHEREGDQHEAITPCLSPLRHPPMNYSTVDVVVVMVAPACTTAQAVRLLKYHFNFRRVIYIVKSPVYCPWITGIAEGVECLDENKVIPGLTYEGLARKSGVIKKHQGVNNRVGWYLQQYLKLGVALHLRDLSKHYLVWDADNIPIQPIDLLAEGGAARLCVNRGAAMFSEYSRFYKAITGLNLLRPSLPGGGGQKLNFVCGYMMMYRPYVAELLLHVGSYLAQQGIKDLYPYNIHRKANELFKSALLSEYDSYGSWLLARHPDKLHLDARVTYVRNPGVRKKGGDKLQCCLTHKRICELAGRGSGGGAGAGRGEGEGGGSLRSSLHTFLIWEEHKFRYRGQDQCVDPLPPPLARHVEAAGTGMSGTWSAGSGWGGEQQQEQQQDQQEGAEDGEEEEEEEVVEENGGEENAEEGGDAASGWARGGGGDAAGLRGGDAAGLRADFPESATGAGDRGPSVRRMGQEDYKQLQGKRSKAKEYPQQEQAVEDFKHFAGLIDALDKRGTKGIKGSGAFLELGCRTGFLLEHLSKGGWKDVRGLELIAASAEFGRRKGRPVHIGDMHDLAQAGVLTSSVQFLFSRHSLEHTLDYMKVLREVRRVVAPAGYAAVVIPIEPVGCEGCTVHELHTQPFSSEATLPSALEALGFQIISRELLVSRMGPKYPARQGQEAAYKYEQRVLARLPS